MGKIKTIQNCARNNQTVEIRYRKLSGETVTRTVRPYEIRQHGENLCLFATDVRKGASAIRSYVVDNIKKARCTKRAFKPEWPVKL